MKDYYYILGIKPTSTTDEIKKAYRKLSMKFHPDQNNGDDFFTERFKEIQEAYEILTDYNKRSDYDRLKSSNETNSNSSHTNFIPYIEYFKSDKIFFEYDQEITFSWKTVNANAVYLKPFGTVQPIGQKTYKIKNLKNENLTFELIAENSNINKFTNSFITLNNKTYNDLHQHFSEKINQEKTKNNYTNFENKKVSKNEDFKLSPGYTFILWICILALFLTFIYLLRS